MSTEKRKVLVVDDDPDVLAMVCEWLLTHGFEVLRATNGLEALLQVKRARPGAVVLDVMMPRLGGLDALKRIRAFDPAATVVVLSANLHADVERQARSLGATACLPKPIALPDLLRALGGPAKASPGERQSPSAARGPVAPEPATGGCVLVVDDDREMRTMLQEALGGWGYATRSAADGAAALRAIVNEPPDIVLLDIDMPGLRGTDALPAIRAVAPDAQVIMVSGTTSEETAKRALALGAFDYVIKPVDLAYLAGSIEAALAARRALGP
ncbi:MAG: response regulator [Candidatus Rokuibacteriota bacterium]